MDNNTNKLPQSFSVAGDFLFDFTAALPDPASIKDVKTGRYIFGNEAMHKLYGLKDVINITAPEITKQVHTPGLNSCVDLILALDKRIKLQKKAVRIENYIQLTARGFVNIAALTKMPVLDHRQHMVAILTFDRNLTETFDWVYLFNLYKEFYPSIPKAISYFLKYLHIDNYFASPPNENELLVLLALKKRYSQRYVANILGLKLKTVIYHLDNIRQKLQNWNLQTLLEDLRHEPRHLN